MWAHARPSRYPPVVWMNRRRADLVVAVFVGVVLVAGSALTWQAYQQQQALASMGDMMDGSMTGLHGTNPLWYVLVTLLLAAVIGGTYVVVRDDLTTAEADQSTEVRSQSVEGTTDGHAGIGERPGESPNGGRPEARSRPRMLEVLPDDERRILEPIIESPGITQIAVRDRSGFSKSKVSQTVSELEKRGLLYRERQGRTYRVYPAEDLDSDA